MKTFQSKQHAVVDWAKAVAHVWSERPDANEFVVVLNIIDRGICYSGAALAEKKNENDENPTADLFNPGGTD